MEKPNIAPQPINLPTPSLEDIYRIIYLDHEDPFTVLGMHTVHTEDRNIISVRAFLPKAERAFVISEKDPHAPKEYPMTLIHSGGFWEVIIEDEKEHFPYKLKRIGSDGREHVFYDSYSFPPVLTKDDLYLFNEGTNHHIYERLGARPMTLNGVGGVHFAVWAPNARRVSVVGNFNEWDGHKHCMRVRGLSGVWEIFIPGPMEGELYKFEIKFRNHFVFMKTDPYALSMEIAPKTASVVRVLNKYKWNDEDWMTKRKTRDHLKEPIAIYEVHLGSWKRVPEENNRCLTYREIAPQLIEYVKDMGYTHIEFLPLMEHPYGGSWGYQCSGYFAPTSRYGTPEDLMFLIDQCHQNGISVIMDWVPAHFPKDAHALGRFDGTPLYEHGDPRLGEHQDWGTFIFNYRRREVRNFLITNALFWFEKYHIDGLRIDAVASMLYLDYSRRPGEWIPNIYGGRENLEAVSFLQEVNDLVHKYYPGALVIAEESTSWPRVTGPTYLGGLGFDMKWNMGWMNDMLSYMSFDPLFRSYHQGKITFSLFYAFSEKFLLPLSHDEVVHCKGSLINKMPGDMEQKFANLRTFLGFMIGHPGKKLLFMGGDFGQWKEWNNETSLDWHLLQLEPHKKLHDFVRELLHLYQQEPSLYQNDFHHTGFQWIDFRDAMMSTVSFMRKGEKENDFLIFICNFTPVPRHHYKIGVPLKCTYKEVLNSDSEIYGGSNIGNFGTKEADEIVRHDFPYSLDLTLPPLSILILKPVKESIVVKETPDKKEALKDSESKEKTVAEPKEPLKAEDKDLKAGDKDSKKEPATTKPEQKEPPDSPKN